jgi:hypothetical protein
LTRLAAKSGASPCCTHDRSILASGAGNCHVDLQVRLATCKSLSRTAAGSEPGVSRSSMRTLLSADSSRTPAIGSAACQRSLTASRYVTLGSSGSHPATDGVETFVETGSADSPCILRFPNIQPVYQCRQMALTCEDRHF